MTAQINSLLLAEQEQLLNIKDEMVLIQACHDKYEIPLITDVVGIILDYCSSSICAKAFDSKQWYQKLEYEFQQMILPIASTINCKAVGNNPERRCLNIAQQINNFLKLTKLNQLDLFELEDLDLQRKINIIQQIIDNDLCILFEAIYKQSKFNESIEKLLKDENVTIKANNIRKWLEWTKIKNPEKLKQVKEINIRRSKLKTLPIEICYFSHLEYIKANNNRIQQIPELIFRLSRLEELDFNSNKIQEIPENLGKLKHLEILSLNGNQINKIPACIGNLNSLTKLYLGDNKIIGLPESLGNLHKLKEFYIYNNELTKLPNSIGKLNSLTIFEAYMNQLEEIPETIGNLGELNTLKLDNNLIKSLPETLSNLKKINTLFISENKLITLPDFICEYKNMTFISIGNNPFKHLPKSFKNLFEKVNFDFYHISMEKINWLGEVNEKNAADHLETKSSKS